MDLTDLTDLIITPTSPWTPPRAKDCIHFLLGPLERTAYGQCRLCTRATKNRWNARNRDYFKDWREENAAELKVKKKAHYDENAEYYRAEQRRRNAEDPEKKRATDKAYHLAFPEVKRRGLGIVFAPGQTIRGLRAAQNDCCAICHVDLSSLPNDKVHVDHDHALPGVPNVRGILCKDCNTGLGQVKDVVRTLLNLSGYLSRPKPSGPPGGHQWSSNTKLIFELGASKKFLINAQNGCCPGCAVEFNTLKPNNIHVDHVHAINDGSPNVRGVLCRGCNFAIGCFKDSPELCLRAAAYLTTFSVAA